MALLKKARRRFRRRPRLRSPRVPSVGVIPAPAPVKAPNVKGAVQAAAKATTQAVAPQKVRKTVGQQTSTPTPPQIPPQILPPVGRLPITFIPPWILPQLAKKRRPMTEKLQKLAGRVIRDEDSYVILKSKVKEWKAVRLTNGVAIHFGYNDYKRGIPILNDLMKASTWSKHLLHTPLVFNDAVKRMQRQLDIDIRYNL